MDIARVSFPVVEKSVKWSIDSIGRYRAFTALHMAVFVIAMTTFALHGANVRAATLVPVDFRMSAASGKFDDTRQYALGLRLRAPRRLRATHLELAVGLISTSQESRIFTSLGPVWQIPTWTDSWFVRIGFSPTVIAGSGFNGRDMGGNIHFTSSAEVGVHLGERRSFTASLRVQHISNGGLSNNNPGMDMLGLNFSFEINR